MDSSQTRSHPINPRLTLSARREELLFAALDSNSKISAIDPSSSEAFSMAPGSLAESLQAPGSASMSRLEESPIIDYDYEFEGDGSFDYGDFKDDSRGQLIGNLPGTSSDGGDHDSHDKRSHPDEEGEEEEGGGKRREGDERTSKKPGRKPLTSEPTSKRKAQNRAAQRAFRERKEKHLKDLETKVEDLEKASESANHENSILRAQIEKMSIELREYRRRVSINGVPGRASSFGNGLPPYLAKGPANGGLNNPNDINFQFEFPTFGRLPGPSASPLGGTRNSTSPPVANKQTISPMVDKEQVSPRNQSLQYTATIGPSAGLAQAPTLLDGGDMSSLSGLFSPSLLESVGKTSPSQYFSHDNSGSHGSRSSTDSANGNMSTSHNTTYSSPSASSNSTREPSSSCGTSPEPTTTQLPVSKPVDSSLTTIGEERSAANGEGEIIFCDKLDMACGNANNPLPRTLSDPGANSGAFATSAFAMNGIDWFAQQNNNQFDPQLFGDYREPQENILSNEAFGDSFFTDAFALGSDFTNPFNMAPSPVPPKKGLVAQIDEKQNSDYEDPVPADKNQMLSCNTIWDRLQACPRVKDGEFDLDLLCKDLQKKAKCSETGAVVNESDFNKIMRSYVGQQKTTKA
ncbi:unnamed protein product [Diplocarpon coronariae]|uniref:BAP1, transcription factor bZIP n=1 Tax=Diplocarpon coronariae TaxID=2795749 RepID=A0A218Z239_9HELO|nr:hypothetical protein JHW43_009060 [Diplocarpon mali]OWP02077.1 BAP1, transcription factor bZIP [Marssonina coronariae]